MDPVAWPSLAFSGAAAFDAAGRIPEDLEVSARVRDSLEGRFFLGPSTAGEPRDGTILFLQAAGPEALGRLDGLRGCLVLLPAGADPGSLARGNAVLFARNPKYAYARLMTELFPLVLQRGSFSAEPLPGVRTDPGFVLADGVTIEPFVTIGRDSVIGRGTHVMRGASIGPRVRIGEGCMIGEDAVVGEPGFGFAFDGDRPPIRLPHLGGVLVGDRVEIGSHATVSSGTIDPTVLGPDVKINNHVHVGHNCRIGRGTLIGIGASVSGSTRIGERCWLSPGVLVRNKATVGDGVTAGMGAVVVKDVAAHQTVVGLPAKPTGNEVPWYESEKGTP